MTFESHKKPRSTNETQWRWELENGTIENAYFASKKDVSIPDKRFDLGTVTHSNRWPAFRKSERQKTHKISITIRKLCTGINSKACLTIHEIRLDHINNKKSMILGLFGTGFYFWRLGFMWPLGFFWFFFMTNDYRLTNFNWPLATSPPWTVRPHFHGYFWKAALIRSLISSILPEFVVYTFD